MASTPPRRRGGHRGSGVVPRGLWGQRLGIHRSATATLVKTPPLPLQGCTYVIDGQVPPGEAPGESPRFRSHSRMPRPPRRSRASVDTAGPPWSAASCCLPALRSTTVPTRASRPWARSLHQQFVVVEPVVWVDHSGKRWLASFLACGGPNLYWISVDQVDSKQPGGAGSVGSQLTAFQKAPPYTQTGKASFLPIKVDHTDHFVFDDPRVTFAIGRGELIIS